MANSTELLEAMNSKILDIYNAIEAKGGTLPENKNLDNIVSAIESVPQEGGGGDYDIPYFDGGEYGTIAYLDNDNNIRYYTATSENDITIDGNSNSATSWVKTFEDGSRIIRADIIGYSVGSKKTTFGNYLFMSCRCLRVIYGFEKITAFGSSTFEDCYSLNCPIEVNSEIVSLPSGFLRNCYTFNSKVTLPEAMQDIGSYFLSGASRFSRPITLPSGLKTIGDSFMSGCVEFNHEMPLPETLESIGSSFLSSCVLFNQEINIPDGVTVIPNYFLSSASSLNSPIIFGQNITSIGTGFLKSSIAFNQPLILPDTITTIGDSFLESVTAFNAELHLSGALTTIGTKFMYGTYKFKQPLTLPDSIQSIGAQFMGHQQVFVGPLNVGKAYGFTADGYTLSALSASDAAYSKGITLTGENASGWKMGLPDRTSSPYRKLIVAE